MERVWHIIWSEDMWKWKFERDSDSGSLGGDDVVWLQARVKGGDFLKFKVSISLVDTNNNKKKKRTMQSLLLIDMTMMW